MIKVNNRNILVLFITFASLLITQTALAEQQRIVVAQSGGDYTSINGALAAINPTQDNSYVIDVMPGTYIERVTMKSYVNLRGSGKELSIIDGTRGYPIRADRVYNSTVSGFTIKNGYYGIYNTDSSYLIKDNRITGSGFGMYNYRSNVKIDNNLIDRNSNSGISNRNSNPDITNNTIERNNYNGIANSASYTSMYIGIIANNTIQLNGRVGIQNWQGSSPLIRENRFFRNNFAITVSNNGGTAVSHPKIYHNKFSHSWSGSNIHLYSGRATINFNVVDSISGSGWRGAYNVRTNGAVF